VTGVSYLFHSKTSWFRIPHSTITAAPDEYLDHTGREPGALYLWLLAMKSITGLASLRETGKCPSPSVTSTVILPPSFL
jgi:hypothetical protein